MRHSHAQEPAPAVRPVPTVFFFKQDGCGACEAAEPMLEALRAKHPRVLVVPLTLNRHPWSIDGWTPHATPGYALTVNGELQRTHVGVMSAKQLEQWIGKELL